MQSPRQKVNIGGAWNGKKSVLSKFTCSISGHRIAKQNVWHDRLNLRTDCTRCGTVMIRTIKGWRPYDEAKDANTDRLEHRPKRELAGEAV